MFFVILCCILVALPLGRAQDASNVTKIVGGDTVSIENYPYQISVHYQNQFTCGGSILSKNFALTAGHCTYNRPASSLKLRVGSNFAFTGGRLESVRQVNIHPNYVQGQLDYDISILRFSNPIEYSMTVRPIELPASGELVYADVRGVVTGWGTLTQNGAFPTRLQAVYLRTLPYTECKRSVPQFVTERMLCGNQEGNRGFCNGDSGGPYVINNKVIGVVSWTIACGNQSYPAVFARVPALRTYIKQITGL